MRAAPSLVSEMHAIEAAGAMRRGSRRTGSAAPSRIVAMSLSQMPSGSQPTKPPANVRGVTVTSNGLFVEFSSLCLVSVRFCDVLSVSGAEVPAPRPQELECGTTPCQGRARPPLGLTRLTTKAPELELELSSVALRQRRRRTVTSDSPQRRRYHDVRSHGDSVDRRGPPPPHTHTHTRPPIRSL